MNKNTLSRLSDILALVPEYLILAWQDIRGRDLRALLIQFRGYESDWLFGIIKIWFWGLAVTSFVAGSIYSAFHSFNLENMDGRSLIFQVLVRLVILIVFVMMWIISRKNKNKCKFMMRQIESEFERFDEWIKSLDPLSDKIERRNLSPMAIVETLIHLARDTFAASARSRLLDMDTRSTAQAKSDAEKFVTECKRRFDAAWISIVTYNKNRRILSEKYTKEEIETMAGTGTYPEWHLQNVAAYVSTS